MSDNEAIKKYYTETQFEYKLLWNWRLKAIPALHFGFYDNEARSHAAAVVRANEALAEWAGIRRGDRIVDAGCGLGQATIWLSKNYHSHVTGITIVPKQLHTINRQLLKDPEPLVDFMLADYLHMPFEPESLEVVWAVESVCHARQKERFYKEAYRVLKPGGKLVMAEYIRSARPLPNDGEKYLNDIFNKWAIPDLDTIDEHEQHAIKAGFLSFANRDVTANVMQSYKNLRETCRRYKRLSNILFKAGIISRVRQDNMESSLRQADALEQGLFLYHHICAIK